MKQIKKSLILITLALSIIISSCTAQVKHAKTETVKIYGNCSMCEKTIERAGTVKKVAKVNWDKDSKMATITYDSTKTNQDEILKRIALAGYDSDKFFAPDDVYSKLEGCCQYERVNKTAMVTTEVTKDHTMDKHETKAKAEVKAEPKQEINQLKGLFDNYFALKDALVKSDEKLASSVAKDLLSSINAVKMNKLAAEEHTVWMKVMGSLNSNTEKIATSTSIEKQRNAFMDLSANIYDLIKVSKQEIPTYYQHCPMANDGKGANWLSKENTIKNPYYGSQMLTCGKTVETIK